MWETYTLNKLTKSLEFKKLSTREKDIVFNILQQLIPNKNQKNKTSTDSNSTAFFECVNCKYTEVIKKGTMIYNRIIEEDVLDDIKDYSDIVKSNTLPRTKDYICHNKECVTHKDHTKKEAVFTRIGSTFRLIYICTECATSWYV